MREIKVEIDSLGRVKPKGKGLGQQYENNVAKYVLELDSSLISNSYFYYIVVVPPSSSGAKQYAVPLIDSFEYLITTAVTQYVGTYKFCLLVMSKELEGDNIPIEGVVNISNEWEDEVVRGVISKQELSEQVVDGNIEIVYRKLLELKDELETSSTHANEQGNYAKLQGDYAKTQGDYAKEQGNYAKTQGAYAKTQGDYANGRGKYANEQGTYAKTQGDYANEQGTYAKTQGDYAKMQGDYAKNVRAEYNGKINRLRANQISGTASGTEIVVEDSAEMECILQLSGNSEQDSRSGKNKFDYKDTIIASIDGLINVLNDDGTITTKGTPTLAYTGITNAKDITDSLEDGKTYTVAQSNANTQNVYAQITATKADGSGSIYFIVQPNTKTRVFTVDKTTYKTYKANILTGTNITTERNFTSGYMILKGSYTDDNLPDFEPYGVQPSLDYPSEIRSVKSRSDNLFDSDYSLVTKGGFVKRSDGSYYRSTAAVVNAIWENTEGYTGQMTIKGEMKWVNYSAYAGETLHVEYTDGTKVSSQQSLNNINFRDKFGKFEYTTDGSKVVKQINLSYGGSSESYFRNIMLNKGAQALPCQQYGEMPVEAKVEGKNLALWEVGTIEQNTGTDLTATTRVRAVFDIVAGEEYVINIPYERFRNLVILNKADIMTGNYQNCMFNRSDNYFSFVSTISGKAKIVISNTDGNTDIDINQYNGVIQLERGSTPTQVEEYKTKTIFLSLGDIQLRSAPDGTRDTFTRVNGEWNYVKKIDTDMYDGSDDEAWSYGTQASNTDVFRVITSKSKFADVGRRIGVRANKFQVGTYDGFWENMGKKFMCALSNGTSGGNHRLFFTTDSSQAPIASVDDWKIFLASNPVIVDYILDTPVYTPITDQALILALDELEELILHKGYNHITVTAVNGVKAYLDLTYYKDINTVLNNINASILSLGGEVNV